MRQNFDLVVSAIAKAIIKASGRLRPARVLINQGSLFGTSNRRSQRRNRRKGKGTDTRIATGANINRSPTAYLRNPPSERALYAEGDTDKNMTLLKFVDATTGEVRARQRQCPCVACRVPHAQ